MPKKLLVSTVVFVLAQLSLPAVGGASVTLGAPLTGALVGSACATGPYCTHTTRTAPVDRVLAAPFDGVIVRWSIRISAGPADNATLRVLREVTPPTTYRGIRSSEVGQPSTGTATSTFASHVPIAAGDHIGLDLPQTVGVYAAATGANKLGWDPALANGETRIETGIPGSASEVQVQAVLERDSDQDGLGDETQDKCPGDAQTSGSCPIPPATLDTQAPTESFKLVGKRPKLARALRKGLDIAVTSNEAGTLSASAFTKPKAFKAVAGPGNLVLASAQSALAAPGTKTLKLKFGRVAKRSLKRARKVKLTIEATASDASRNSTTKTLNVTLKR